MAKKNIVTLHTCICIILFYLIIINGIIAVYLSFEIIHNYSS